MHVFFSPSLKAFYPGDDEVTQKLRSVDRVLNNEKLVLYLETTGHVLYTLSYIKWQGQNDNCSYKFDEICVSCFFLIITCLSNQWLWISISFTGGLTALPEAPGSWSNWTRPSRLVWPRVPKCRLAPLDCQSLQSTKVFLGPSCHIPKVLTFTQFTTCPEGCRDIIAIACIYDCAWHKNYRILSVPYGCHCRSCFPPNQPLSVPAAKLPAAPKKSCLMWRSRMLRLVSGTMPSVVALPWSVWPSQIRWPRLKRGPLVAAPLWRDWRSQIR